MNPHAFIGRRVLSVPPLKRITKPRLFHFAWNQLRALRAVIQSAIREPWAIFWREVSAIVSRGYCPAGRGSSEAQSYVGFNTTGRGANRGECPAQVVEEQLSFQPASLVPGAWCHEGSSMWLLSPHSANNGLLTILCLVASVQRRRLTVAARRGRNSSGRDMPPTFVEVDLSYAASADAAGFARQSTSGNRRQGRCWASVSRLCRFLPGLRRE